MPRGDPGKGRALQPLPNMSRPARRPARKIDDAASIDEKHNHGGLYNRRQWVLLAANPMFPRNVRPQMGYLVAPASFFLSPLVDAHRFNWARQFGSSFRRPSSQPRSAGVHLGFRRVRSIGVGVRSSESAYDAPSFFAVCPHGCGSVAWDRQYPEQCL